MKRALCSWAIVTTLLSGPSYADPVERCQELYESGELDRLLKEALGEGAADKG